MKKIIASFLLLALPLLASAYKVVKDGIYYNLNTATKTAEVTNNNQNGGTNYSGSITIPESIVNKGMVFIVKSIGQSAFINQRSLTSITIPNTVTNIGNNAFWGCSSLASINIPNSVTNIGSNAFIGCSDLTSISIPSSVTNIRNNAFIGCSGLTSIKVENDNSCYDSRDNCNAIIETESNTLIAGCKNTVIPNTVTTIGNEAFSGCSGLTSMTIPNCVTTISDYAFHDCTNLESVTIPNSVTSFGEYVFMNCSSLTSINIPNSVTSFGNHTFYGCSSLVSVNIPNSVTTIGHEAFALCSSLASINIPNSVTSIGDYAFVNCSTLTSVTIPNTVTSIGRDAFYGCAGLSSVISMMEEPCSINEYCFDDGVFNNTTLYVPKGTIEKYKSTNYWNKFQHIEEGNPFEHTLTYLVDGETYSTYTLEEGDAITPDEAPTKEGYSFSGWSDIPETMPASDLTITGTFVPNKYKLTYFVDGGEYKSSEVEFGSAIIAEDNPTKEGYTFSGWSEIPETMPASDVTITGSFTINKYKLTYTLDGEEYKTAEVDYGTALTPEESPTKEGYTFSGWSEIPETMPASDVTITGTFTINTYTITYMVDNALLTTEEVTYGSTITPPVSLKEGYEITWNSHPTTMPAYDITIYGSYIATGINGLYAEESDKKVYTPDGKRIQSPKKGMNIIRMSDGTVKKVVVK